MNSTLQSLFVFFFLDVGCICNLTPLVVSFLSVYSWLIVELCFCFFSFSRLVTLVSV